MDAREDLPKVSVETEQDWKRIQSNLDAALTTRLDLELESQGRPGSKSTLMPHINQFMDSLLEIARPNMRINGRTTEDPCEDEDAEPFDEALDRHIWSLSDQRLKWDKEIASRRRTRPGEIGSAMLEDCGQHHLPSLDCNHDTMHDELIPNHLPARLEQTLMRTTALSSQLIQSSSSQHDRAVRFKSVSADVKALKL